MAIRRLSTASIKTGSKSNKMWDQDTAQGAMVPIASVSLTNDSTRDVTFTGIPQIYQDLRIVFNHRANSSASTTDSIILYFAGYNSPASGYSQTDIKGNGASASSTRGSSAAAFNCGLTPAINAGAGIFGTTTIDVMNYANTSTFKSLLIRNAVDLNGSGESTMTAGLVRTTLALDRLTFFPNNGTAIWVAGTSCTLYGIKAGV